jgi:predicted amidophosphoribosyltransferase
VSGQGWWPSALELVLPAVCPLCHEASGAGLCAACLAQFEPVADPCPWCGAPGGAADCPSCRHRGFAHIAATRCAWTYRGACRRLVTRAKAEARPAAVRACAGMMPRPEPAHDPRCVVVAVPPAPGRRPGPHLGTALAAAYARVNRLRLAAVLGVTRLADEQHRLGLGERRANVEGLFVCRGSAPERVILIDDLITTGATASAAAAALQAGGCRRIELVALARTPRTGGR